MSFANRFFEAVRTYGDRPAIISGREELSYEQLLAQSERLASNLSVAGIGPGTRVGIAVQDSLEAMLCALACWRLAATPAMIDFRAPRPYRAKLARDFDLVVVIESRPPPGTDSYPSMPYDREWRFSSTSTAANMAPVDSSNPAFLLFSSGTTGDPKAYIQSHDSLLERTTGRLVATPSGRPPRFLTGMTLTYAATRHYTLTYLLAGAAVRLMPPLFNTSEMMEALLSFEATGSSQPPPVIARMAEEAGERSEVLFPMLQVFDSVGGPARAEDKVAAWKNLTRGYRMRYASSLTGAVSLIAGEDVPARPETVGRLLTGVRVDILGSDNAVLPIGETGVIRAWTRTMASSVLLPGGRQFVDPKVMGDGWGIPGDLGFMDDKGFLTIVDRTEDMIVRGGVNIAPRELENVIRTLPKVIDVAVVGFDDAAMGQEIAAFVVGAPDLTVGEVRAFLAANVPPERRPREVRLVATLPLNENGKLLRRVLVQGLLEERAGARS